MTVRWKRFRHDRLNEILLKRPLFGKDKQAVLLIFCFFFLRFPCVIVNPDETVVSMKQPSVTQVLFHQGCLLPVQTEQY